MPAVPLKTISKKECVELLTSVDTVCIVRSSGTKTLTGDTEMLTVAYTNVDFFGCFGPVDALATTDVCPTGMQVACIVYHASCGDALDATDSTILDLLMAGF